MTRQPSDIVVVASHPRSGTHLLIDFLRLNFPEFNVWTPIWRSSAYLYHDIDNPKLDVSFFHQRLLKGGRVIVKTHDLSPKSVDQKLATQLPFSRRTVLMPFRTYEKSLASFTAFARQNALSPNGAMQDSDGGSEAKWQFYYGKDLSPVESARLHARRWLEAGALPVCMESLLRAPELTAAALAAVLARTESGSNNWGRPVRLPRKKRFQGRFAEIHQRLIGRESSEVQVAWTYTLSAQERQYITAELDDTYRTLVRSSINPIS